MDRSYNNSFGAGETGGDIILPAAGKKSRKGLVAAIVIVLLVLVGAGVGVWFALQPRGDSATGSSVRAIFNEYANYIVYGENSTEDMEIAETMDEWALELSYNNDGFLAAASELYNGFYNLIGGGEYKEYEGIALDDVKTFYQFLLDVDNVNLIGDDALWRSYVNDGKDAALDFVDNFFDEENGNYLIVLLESYSVARAKTLLNYWEVYDEFGCIVDGAVSETCAVEIPSDRTYELALRLGDADAAINGLVSSVVTSIKNQCVDLIKAFDGTYERETLEKEDFGDEE